MKRYKKTSYASDISSSPGSTEARIKFIGEVKIDKPFIKYIQFKDKLVEEKEFPSFDQIPETHNTENITWINLTGLQDVHIIEKLGARFNIHPLVLETIANTEHHPKIEFFDDYIFIEMKLLTFQDYQSEISSEQLAIIVGKGYVLSFLESENNIFDNIIDRIKFGGTRINRMGADFLCYSMIDNVIDTYFAMLDRIEEQVEDLEEILITNPTIETLQKIHSLKRIMIFFRKAIWPLREVIRKLEMADSNIIVESTDLYIKDLYDHIIQIIETLETILETLSMMFDIYLSSMSNKMNEVMKVLTIIATIFIPLTFLVGVYGMNFKFMPELEWEWSYPLLWLIMISVSVWMLFSFKKKRWI
jgi:magnesium transporter